jgi:flagellar basal-body rod protein FlgB
MVGEMEGVGSAMIKLALDAAVLRHQAIAQNIANLQSEGYVPLRVSFEEELAQFRRSGVHAGEVENALRDLKPQLVYADRAPGPRPQDVDTELVALSENTIHYQVLLRALNRQMSIISEAMDEGKKS